jgi:hypothetical protein
VLAAFAVDAGRELDEEQPERASARASRAEAVTTVRRFGFIEISVH